LLHLTRRKPADFLAAVEDDPLEPLDTVALTTGMRLGEVLGLRWQAVDDAIQVRVTLGHTSVAITLDRCSHVIPRCRRKPRGGWTSCSRARIGYELGYGGFRGHERARSERGSGR